jgi:hypothetical protein
MKRMVVLAVLAAALLVPVAEAASPPPTLAAKLQRQRLQVTVALTLANAQLVRCHVGTVSPMATLPIIRTPICMQAVSLRAQLVRLVTQLKAGRPAATTQVLTLLSHAHTLGAVAVPSTSPGNS